MSKMNFKHFILFITIFSFHFALQVSAQQWIVPEEQKGIVSPYLFTADSIKKGETVYIKNCQSCHGNPGKKNWAKITPEPGDPADDKFQEQTDGEMYFRITTGKAPMPEFRNILTDSERWNVIAFIRSFNPTYIQPNPVSKDVVSGKIIKLDLRYEKEINKIMITAREITKEKQIIPAQGVEIVLFVKRYFGNMQVDEIKTTNQKGEVHFNFPADLPGNHEGNLEFYALVHDNTGKLGESSVRTNIAVDTPGKLPSLVATRAWWSARDKAPVWVILTYSITVIVVWGFIFYILYSVIQIRKTHS